MWRILRLSVMCALLTTARAHAASMTQVMGKGPARAELDSEYPSPPKTLPTADAGVGLLLVDFDFGFPMGGYQISGAAVRAADSTASITRVKAFNKHRVLFHSLPGGTYTLRFIKAEAWRQSEIVLAVPADSAFTVTITPGRITYLGTVRVHGTAEMAHDVRRERDAWRDFLKKYPQAPWAHEARARLDSLPGH